MLAVVAAALLCEFVRVRSSVSCRFAAAAAALKKQPIGLFFKT